jgi:NAD(P)-dependent dehydrogenase (short-subunit alcohol dehydrogenase family)
MKLKGSTVLVTGANRGLGRSFAKALREAGCAKVYAAARRIESLASDSGIAPIQLDITMPSTLLQPRRDVAMSVF